MKNIWFTGFRMDTVYSNRSNAILLMKPGEMDLGGDGSRLFFYDPVNYLRYSVLFCDSKMLEPE